MNAEPIKTKKTTSRIELSLWDYLLVIRKRMLWIILAFFCVLGGSIFYTFTITPTYQAVAIVRITERKVPVEPVPTTTVWWSYTNPIESEVGVITSAAVMEKVARKLGLLREDATQKEIESQTASVRGTVFAKSVKDTDAIRIIVDHTSPTLAARIANTTAEVYAKQDFQRKVKQATAVREYIEEQVKIVRERLNQLEEELKQAKESGEVTGAGEILITKLTTLEREKAELLGKYTMKHPKAAAIEDQINDIKKQLQALPEGEMRVARMAREIGVQGRVYEGLMTKLSEARIVEAEKVEEVQILDRASIPTRPIKPNMLSNAGAGAGAGVILGFLIAFLIESLDTSLITIESVEALTGLPVLAVIPFIKIPKRKERPRNHPGKVSKSILQIRQQLILFQKEDDPILEAYRTLRTNIQLRRQPHQKVILFTSSLPVEGKTVTVCNLAITMAKNRLKTLLVDSDFRRSDIHTVFGIPREPGLGDVLTETCNFEDSLRTFVDVAIGDFNLNIADAEGLDYLHIVTAGYYSGNPTELLTSPDLEVFLQKARSRYDVVVLNSPPVLLVTDPVLLSSKVDAVVIVYKVGKTSKEILLRAKEELERGKGNILGMVLNNIKPSLAIYPSQYHYKYGYEARKAGK
ncbi:MAG: polysaccharide biosynthesis tyrosine autokinase [Candidatus Brocadiaceae bacterium]|nr:polysaccharide biosynthesis tyrosine autokinase [Candidatus Brocadiaceae bacterium]